MTQEEYRRRRKEVHLWDRYENDVLYVIGCAVAYALLILVS